MQGYVGSVLLVWLKNTASVQHLNLPNVTSTLILHLHFTRVSQFGT